jgi:Rieske Fe-S protein
MLLSDLIAGRRNPWESLYNPSRLSQAKGVVEFIKENANVAAQYADWVRPGQVSSVDQIPRGGGAVLRNGASLVAVHRDSEGELHYRSAVCPHLKCIVQWNHGENSWDCPCHGSRFSATGQVLNGPANSDLPTAQT